MTLSEIPIRLIQDNSTGMARVIMAELKDHLENLLKNGETHAIDLFSLPMSETDLDELADYLGVGEVSATISNIGSSSLRETAYRGIWWVTHYADDGKVIGELIEVARVPEILFTHDDEIRHSASAIAQYA
jgi:hydrogenase-1 operon protein HyaF